MTIAPARIQIEVIATTMIVTGEIDSHSRDDLALAMTPLLLSGHLTVNMASVYFIDTSGLRVLVDAHHFAQQSGHRFAISLPSRRVEKILDMSDVGHMIEVVGRNRPRRSTEARTDPGGQS